MGLLRFFDKITDDVVSEEDLVRKLATSRVVVIYGSDAPAVASTVEMLIGALPAVARWASAAQDLELAAARVGVNLADVRFMMDLPAGTVLVMEAPYVRRDTSAQARMGCNFDHGVMALAADALRNNCKLVLAVPTRYDGGAPVEDASALSLLRACLLPGSLVWSEAGSDLLDLALAGGVCGVELSTRAFGSRLKHLVRFSRVHESDAASLAAELLSKRFANPRADGHEGYGEDR